MDEGTLNQSLNVVFTGHFVWGGEAIWQVLNLVKNRVSNSCRIWSTVQFIPPPQTHTVRIYCTFSLERGGGGEEVREKIEGQHYTSIVPSSMGATVHKQGRKYQPMSECTVSPVYKIC